MPYNLLAPHQKTKALVKFYTNALIRANFLNLKDKKGKFYWMRLQSCFEHSKPPAMQPDSFKSLPETVILPM